MTDDTIRGLDNSQAVRVLTTFARARLRGGGVGETEWTPELDRALRLGFPAGTDAGPAASVSEGDLARQALLLLADDPQDRETLAVLIEGSPRSRSRSSGSAPSLSSLRCSWRYPDPRDLRAGQEGEDLHQDREEADVGQPAEGTRAKAARVLSTTGAMKKRRRFPPGTDLRLLQRTGRRCKRECCGVLPIPDSAYRGGRSCYTDARKGWAAIREESRWPGSTPAPNRDVRRRRQRPAPQGL